MEKKPFDHAFAFKDDLGVRETFADGLHLMTFDGAVAKLTFTVSRPDEIKEGFKGPPRGQKVPAARLVLPAPALAALFNQLHQLMGALEAQGLVTRDGDAVRPTVQ